MQTVKTILMALAVCVVIVGAIWLEIDVWQECRTDHSWFYCMRVLNK